MHRRHVLQKLVAGLGLLAIPDTSLAFGGRRRNRLAGCMTICPPARATRAFGWESVAIAIGEGILGKVGAAAYDKLLPNGEDVQAQTLTAIYNSINDAVNRSYIATAIAEHNNAKRQLEYYRNTGRRESLHDAGLMSGRAMFQLEQTTFLTAFHTWTIAAELHMSILQEWHNLEPSSGTQANINLHYNYMLKHFIQVRNDFLRNCKYCIWQYPDPDVRAYYYCGPDVFPTCEDVVSRVAVSDGVVVQMSRIVAR